MAVLMVKFTTVAAGPIKDPDAWWHLRVGHQFWSGAWTLRDTGPLSSFATEEWTPRDWIPQLVSSKFEDWFGLPGVAWLYGAALLAFLTIAYFVCRRFSDPLASALAVTLTAIGASGSLSQRPQMVSFIFMLVVVWAWWSSIQDLKPRWWLVPLAWIWAASHGMWYCGIAVGLVAVGGLVLDRRVSRRQAFTLFSVPALSLVASAATPVGPRLWLTLFDTTGMWQFVSEWQPPSFRELGPAVTMLMIFIVVANWARRADVVPWTHIGLLATATGWTLLSGRTVALGAIVLAPLVAGALQALQPGRERVPIRRPEPIFVGVALATCLSTLSFAVASTATTAGDVPNGLNDSLDELSPGTAIINEYTLGGWLHWRHPRLNTVVDGFTDGYTTEAVSEFLSATAVAPGWDDYVAGTDAHVALLPIDSPLADALVDRLGWDSAGEDAGYVLLTSAN
jgi:hypothetical protein